MDTGDTFRSYVLGVMSPARFLCATPVKMLMFMVPRAMTTSFFKVGELEFYRWQVSILWPSAYKAITISLSDVMHIEFDDRRCFRRSAAELHRYYLSSWCEKFLVEPLRIWWNGALLFFPLCFAVALMGFEPATWELLDTSSANWAMCTFVANCLEHHAS